MPLIEYRCKKCGQVTEVLTRAASDERPVCEACGSKDLKKVLSSFSARVAPTARSERCSSCSNDACPLR
jgi:putative FmdB family regulatory protein